MKKFSKKGGLLFATMAVCAFAMPGVASAASWGVVGSEHQLVSNQFTFENHTGLTSNCTNSTFTVSIANSQVLTITTAAFAGCTTAFPAAGADCTETRQGTGFPWRAAAVTTTLVQISGMHIDIRFEALPGNPTSCGALNNSSTTFTGTVIDGHWSGNASHEVRFNPGRGLTTPVGAPVTLFATLLDAVGPFITVNP